MDHCRWRTRPRAPRLSVGTYEGAITASGENFDELHHHVCRWQFDGDTGAARRSRPTVCRVSMAHSDPSLGVSYTGFVNGETPSVLGGSLSVEDSDSRPDDLGGELRRGDRGVW